MEPLSVIASVVGTADVTFRLCRFLRRTIRGLRDVDKDVIQILDQVENLSLVNQSIREITGAPDFAPKLRGSFADQNFLTRQWTELWRNTEKVSLEAQRVLKDLEKLLRHILGANFQIELDVADEAGDPEPLEQKVCDKAYLQRSYTSTKPWVLFSKGFPFRIPAKTPGFWQQQIHPIANSSKERLQVSGTSGSAATACKQSKLFESVFEPNQHVCVYCPF